MNILDRLDEAEREATPPPWEHDNGPDGQWDRVFVTHAAVSKSRWIEASHDRPEAQADAALIALSRNHLRALIDVARAARELTDCPADIGDETLPLRLVLLPLLAEEGGER